MKTNSLVILLLLSLVQFNLWAQNSVRLSLRLHPVQILTVDPSGQDRLALDQPNDYTDWVFEHSNRFTIYSTSGFQIKISHENVVEQTVPHKHMTVLASAQPNSSQSGSIVFSERHLSEKEQSIITSDRGGFNKQFDVHYKETALLTEGICDSDLNETDNHPSVYNILYTIVSQ